MDIVLREAYLTHFCHLCQRGSSLNPIATRKAKIVYNFGLSECNRVKGNECNRVKGKNLANRFHGRFGCKRPVLEVIKLFSCSTQLSMKL